MNLDNLELSGLSGEQFVRLKDGQSITGVFRGEAVTVRKHFFKDKNPINCTGRECPECLRGGEKPRPRHRLNFVTKDETGHYVAKVFEQGPRVFSSLKDLNTEYDLEHTVVKIKRTGSTKDDTVYTIVPVKDYMLTKIQENELSKVQLIDLTNVEPPAKKEPGKGELPEEDIPF